MAGRLLVLGFLIILAGFAIMALGSTTGQGSSSTGVVIFVGPFPLVFGSGPNSGALITIGLLIALVMVLVALVSLLGWRRARVAPQYLYMTGIGC